LPIGAADVAELRLGDNLAQATALSLAVDNVAFDFGEKSESSSTIQSWRTLR
jgi:hypothetical protein